ncbi:MAG: hypothetical protein J3K34DRAFT_230741 [Monoraphidium minutum]|nr:MAG: hypothetical protein J3K34DRAFT_230741 [Monoraphidium minutum]
MIPDPVVADPKFREEPPNRRTASAGRSYDRQKVTSSVQSPPQVLLGAAAPLWAPVPAPSARRTHSRVSGLAPSDRHGHNPLPTGQAAMPQRRCYRAQRLSRTNQASRARATRGSNAQTRTPKQPRPRPGRAACALPRGGGREWGGSLARWGAAVVLLEKQCCQREEARRRCSLQGARAAWAWPRQGRIAAARARAAAGPAPAPGRAGSHATAVLAVLCRAPARPRAHAGAAAAQGGAASASGAVAVRPKHKPPKQSRLRAAKCGEVGIKGPHA